jgi:hypothetical protein
MSGYYGPSGGTGGHPFDIRPPIEPNYTIDTTPYTIAGIIFYVGSYIDSIQVIYRNTQTEEVILSEKVGGDGGSEFPVDPGPGGYIVAISGNYDNLVNGIFVSFNDGNGVGVGLDHPNQPFDYTTDPSQEVIGLWGRSGTYIDALGVIMRQRLSSPPPPSPS